MPQPVHCGNLVETLADSVFFPAARNARSTRSRGAGAVNIATATAESLKPAVMASKNLEPSSFGGLQSMLSSALPLLGCWWGASMTALAAYGAWRKAKIMAFGVILVAAVSARFLLTVPSFAESRTSCLIALAGGFLHCALGFAIVGGQTRKRETVPVLRFRFEAVASAEGIDQESASWLVVGLLNSTRTRSLLSW